MALPASGIIKISDLVAEFGGTGTHGLSEYYRGGSFVPNVPANSAVPTSGTIKLTDFYGAAAEGGPIMTGSVEGAGAISTPLGDGYGYYYPTPYIGTLSGTWPGPGEIHIIGNETSNFHSFIFAVWGLTSNPGQSYFETFKFLSNDQQFHTSAGEYIWTGGEAIWYWPEGYGPVTYYFEFEIY